MQAHSILARHRQRTATLKDQTNGNNAGGDKILGQMGNMFKFIERRRARFPAGFEKFEDDLLAFYEKNRLTEIDQRERVEAVESVLHSIRQVYSDARLVVVGSTVSTLGRRGTDIDLCLLVRNKHTQKFDCENRFHWEVLKILAAHFRTQPEHFEDARAIDATVPILRFKLNSKYGFFDIDMNCNNVAGVFNTRLLQTYARVDSRLAPLCVLVKHWASKVGLNNPMDGSFNSYSLKLLVVHFLQCASEPPILPNLCKELFEVFGEHCVATMVDDGISPPLVDSEVLHYFEGVGGNTRSLGELLIAFFGYYGVRDFGNDGFDVANARVIARSEHALWQKKKWECAILGPYDGDANAARGVLFRRHVLKIHCEFDKVAEQFFGDPSRPPCFQMIDGDK